MTGSDGWLEGLSMPNSKRVELLRETFLRFNSERAERRSGQGFVAYRWDGSRLQRDAVKDISATGIYILTEERWRTGMFLSLTLQREGPLEVDTERRIDARAKVVRSGKDGVGLAFAVKDAPESRQWESLRESLIQQANPKDMVSLVRMSAAISFLGRICPEGAEKIGQLVRRLSNHKLANVVAIALKAENLVASEAISDRLRVDPDLIVRVLEGGSCTDELWLRDYWSGLLATSSAVDGKDESGPAFVELFTKLTTFPLRILTVVCTRATKVLTESGSVSAKPLVCNLEELMRTTGSQVLQIERDLQRLSELGLIENRDSNSSTLSARDEAYITPSRLGLKLFARCNGHRGFSRGPHSASSPSTPLRTN